MRKHWIAVGMWVTLVLGFVILVTADSDSAIQVIELRIVPWSKLEMIDPSLLQAELEPGEIQTGSVTLRIWSNTPWQLLVSAEVLSAQGETLEVIPPESFTYTSSFEAVGKNVRVVDIPTQFSTTSTFVAEGLDYTTGNEGVEVTLLYIIKYPLDWKPGQYQTVFRFTLVPQ